MRNIFTYIVTALVITACTGGHEFSGFKDLPADGWVYGDRCDFTVDLPVQEATRHIMLSLTHDNSYPYSNLWVEMTLADPTGTLSVDTVNIEMCDPAGNWYGKGMPGHYQLSDTLTRHPVILRDSTRLTLRHIMRVDTLRGISQVGVELVH